MRRRGENAAALASDQAKLGRNLGVAALLALIVYGLLLAFG